MKLFRQQICRVKIRKFTLKKITSGPNELSRRISAELSAKSYFKFQNFDIQNFIFHRYLYLF